MIEFLTFLLVIITSVYAYLTYLILEANRKAVGAMESQVQASTRPYVNFDLISDGPGIEAKLWNTGLTAAIDVEISTTPALTIAVPNHFQPSLLANGKIAFLSPNREFREFIGSWTELREQGNGRLEFKVSLKYKDTAGNAYLPKEFLIDLTGLDGMPYIGRPKTPEELKAIAESLQEIQKHLSAISKK